MRNGKFNEQIYDAIEQADDFILILSKDALNRCSLPDDWVRIEIEHALKFKKNIIIVNTEAEIIFPADLPDSLRELPSYHAMTLNQEYYEESIDRLMKMLSGKKGSKDSIKTRGIAKSTRIAVIVACSVVLLGFIGLLIYKFSSQDETNRVGATNSGLIAKLYLPRYADIDREILDTPWFDADKLHDFKYVDSIINEQYHIFPVSDYFTNEVLPSLRTLNGVMPCYHNLPLRLSIHNTKSDTQVINGAQLEIMEIHPLSTVAITVNQTADSLCLISQTSYSNPTYKLAYTSLKKGESSTSYEKEITVKDDSYSIPAGKDDSIRGKVMANGKEWVFSSSGSRKSFIVSEEKSRKMSTISPASSNVKVFYVDISSLEAPKSYPIAGISRQIVKGEVDDDVYVIIRSEMSFDAKIRIKIITVNNTEIYTEPISIRYLKPIRYENNPF